MPSSGMLRSVAVVRIDVSEERITSITRVTVIPRCVLRLLVTVNGVPTSLILVTLMMEALHSSETSVLTKATRRNIPDDGILHLHVAFGIYDYVYCDVFDWRPPLLDNRS
jgi:hypothetical protein